MWPFLTVITGLLAAVLGALVGHGLSLWQNRLLPWVAVQKFSTTTVMAQLVRLDTGLVAAAEESWIAIPLAPESRLTVVQSALNAATNMIAANVDSAATIDSALDRLRAATTLPEVRAAILPLLLHGGIKDLLVSAIWRDEIPVPADDDTIPLRLAYDFRADINGGSFVIDFPNSRPAFGSNLSVDRVLTAKLLPFAIALSKLRRDEIVQALEALHPHLRAQLRHTEHVARGTRALINQNSRWTAPFSISNYGSGPMVLFTNDAQLWISHNEFGKFWIPSHIAYHGEGGALMRQTGVFLIPSGNTNTYQLVTDLAQSEMTGGSQLWEIWESGTAVGHVRLKVLGPQLRRPKIVRSQELPFTR